MTDESYTHIIIIRDRSGSMIDIATDMDGGLKTYLAEQAEEKGRASLSLYDFDDECEQVMSFRAVNGTTSVPPLIPRGSTALLDAIGTVITREGEALAVMYENLRPAHVLVQIITDGWENASIEWTKSKVKDLIIQQERDYGWTIAYLGTKIDAFKEAGGLGIKAGSTMSFPPSSHGATAANLAASHSTSRLRRGEQYILCDEDELK